MDPKSVSGALALLVFSLALAIAWAGEPETCEVVLSAGVCPAGHGEVRPAWPLPEGCECPARTADWSCWLPGREASAAQDLGEIDSARGTHHWRVLSQRCDEVRASLSYVCETPEYVATVATARAIETKAGKATLKGGFSGRPPVEVGATAQALTTADALQIEAAKPPSKEAPK